MSNNSLVTNQKLSLATGLLESSDMAAIFGSFLHETSKHFLEEVGCFFMFPIAAACAFFQIIWAARALHLSKGKQGTRTKLGVDLLGGLAVIGAVGGTILFPLVVGPLSPFIFTGMLAFKTLFHFGATLYYAGKAAVAGDPEKREAYRQMARANFVATTALLFSAIAVVGVMIFGKIPLAIFGLAGALIGIGNCVNHLVSKKQAEKNQKPQDNAAHAEHKEPLQASKNSLIKGRRRTYSTDATPHPSSTAFIRNGFKIIKNTPPLADEKHSLVSPKETPNPVDKEYPQSYAPTSTAGLYDEILPLQQRRQ